MNIRVLTVFFRFFTEWTFASMIFLMLHLLSWQHMPLFATMGIAAAASILFILLLDQRRNLAKPLYFLVIMPFVFLAGIAAGLELFYIAIMAVMIFWRSLKFHEDSTSYSESIWLLLTFVVGLFLLPFANINSGEYLKQIIFILIFQLLFILSGQFLLKWLEIELAKKRVFMFAYSRLLGFLLLLVTAFTFGRDLLKDLFFLVLQVIGWTFSLLLYPLFAWIVSPTMKERVKDALPKQEQMEEYEPPVETGGQVFDFNLWGSVFFAILIVLAFYFLYKKSNLFSKEQDAESAKAGFVTAIPLNDSSNNRQFSKRLMAVPDNHIRKEVFHLEKYAHKRRLGRLNHESVTEWFDRIGIQYDSRTILAYEEVRYGGQEKVHNEGWFKDDIKYIKKQFKTLGKEGKQEEKATLKHNFKNVFKR